MGNFAKFAWTELLTLAVYIGVFAQTARPDGNERAATIVRAAPADRILPAPTNYRFPDGQSYVYAVEWHLFNAGTAVVKMEPAGQQRKVTAVADSAGVVNVLFRVHDRFEGYFNPRTFCSERVVKHTEEGSRQRETDIRFDYRRGKSVLDEKNLKTGEAKHTENDIPACVTDVVTGFYYLAALPLQTGNSYNFPVSDGGKTADVLVRVEAREKVKAPAGTFQALRVTAEPTNGSLRKNAKIWVWFSDDAKHTPVQMRAKMGWGTLVFRLQRLGQ
jgi:Protein of unknown function (DUF3108)